MSDGPEDLAEVQRKLAEIQHRKRDDIRWSISRHTAERAIEAIEAAEQSEPGRGGPPRSGKARRRKRHKRLL